MALHFFTRFLLATQEAPERESLLVQEVHLNHDLKELPPYEKMLFVTKGEVVPFPFSSGVAMVKIHHTKRICNLVIFFGIVGEEFVHGYLDYEGKVGRIATDE